MNYPIKDMKIGDAIKYLLKDINPNTEDRIEQQENYQKLEEAAGLAYTIYLNPYGCTCKVSCLNCHGDCGCIQCRALWDEEK